jgi:trans-aconitate 3-methyltransferase
MSTETPTKEANVLETKEKTFSSYTQEQGKAYAAVRVDYHPKVYQLILDHHTSTGGQLDSILDVGCGPGLASRNLAPHFAHAAGLDPSEGMLATARGLGGASKSGEAIRYVHGTAEALQGIADASVDLVTASNAAHWFDMAGFWPAAARVLRPGGTVAIWTSGPIRAHPGMVAAARVQEALDAHAEVLKPYEAEGSLIVRGRYSALVLPWQLEEPVGAFQREGYVRQEWDVGEDFFVGMHEAGLEALEKVFATSSAMTRWHQAHPDLVGTEKDSLRILRRELEKVLQEAGVEPGKERIKGDVQGVVLLFKKRTS